MNDRIYYREDIFMEDNYTLSNEELAQVSAGYDTPIMPEPDTPYRPHFGDTFRCVECWYEIYDITPTTCLPGICPGCGSTAGWERY